MFEGMSIEERQNALTLLGDLLIKPLAEKELEENPKFKAIYETIVEELDTKQIMLLMFLLDGVE